MWCNADCYACSCNRTKHCHAEKQKFKRRRNRNNYPGGSLHALHVGARRHWLPSANPKVQQKRRDGQRGRCLRLAGNDGDVSLGRRPRSRQMRRGLACGKGPGSRISRQGQCHCGPSPGAGPQCLSWVGRAAFGSFGGCLPKLNTGGNRAGVSHSLDRGPDKASVLIG